MDILYLKSVCGIAQCFSALVKVVFTTCLKSFSLQPNSMVSLRVMRITALFTLGGGLNTCSLTVKRYSTWYQALSIHWGCRKSCFRDLRLCVRPLLSGSYRYSKVSVPCFPTFWKISGWICCRDNFLSVQMALRWIRDAGSFSENRLLWCSLPKTDKPHEDKPLIRNLPQPLLPGALSSQEIGKYPHSRTDL